VRRRPDVATQDRINNASGMRRNPVGKDERQHRQRSHDSGRTTREMAGKIACRAIVLLRTQVMMMLGKRDQLQAEQYGQEKIQHAAQA